MGLKPWTHDTPIGFIDVADEVMMDAEAESIDDDVQGLHAKTGCTEEPRITVMAGNVRFDF